MKKNDGGPAFPSVLNLTRDPENEWQTEDGGMNLREYYAGQALPGTIAAWAETTGHDLIVEACVNYADALIAELEKENDE